MMPLPLLVFLLAVSMTLIQPHPRDEVRRHLMEAAERDWFTGAAIVVGPRAAIIESAGWADAQRRRPNSPATRYRIGSLTKQFTGAAILLLAEERRLDVHDRLSRHLPGRSDVPDVTIHQLLTHSSGLVELSRLPDFDVVRRSARSTDDFLRRVRDEPLLFAPDAATAYSNVGYLWLTRVIESAAGMTYARFLETRLFAPLGMTGSGLESGGPDVHALGYTRNARGETEIADDAGVGHLAGAGALYSTPADMAIWARAVRERTLLRSESWTRMLTAYIDGYGYGWKRQVVAGREAWHHGALVPGFASSMTYWPDSGTVIVVLKNHDTLPRVFDPIAMLATVAQGDAWQLPAAVVTKPMTDDQLAPVLGTYEAPPSIRFVVTAAGSGIQVQMNAQPPVPFAAVGAFDFRSDRLGASITFERDAGGRVHGLVLTQSGRSIRATRERRQR